jgi:hypothetical protein
MFAEFAKIYSLLDLGLAYDLCTACSRIVYSAENWQMRGLLQQTLKCLAMRNINKTKHETTSTDRCMLGGEYFK